MTAAQRKTWVTVLAALAAPIAVWALTAGASTAGRAWDGKESVVSHDADVGKLRTERDALRDSLRADARRTLDAICYSQPNIPPCKDRQ